MPDVHHFWDRLTMEVRRALTEDSPPVLLVQSVSVPNATANVSMSSGATRERPFPASSGQRIPSTAWRPIDRPHSPEADSETPRSSFSGSKKS